MNRRASVRWIPKAAGGRISLPEGKRYVTISRFPEEGPSWPDGAWSVVIAFMTPPAQQGNPSVGTASFLMETAPQARLEHGTHFELYEGLRKVADVELLDD
jgi:hypothetical protein